MKLKPLFATVAGRGPHTKYMTLYMYIYTVYFLGVSYQVVTVNMKS